VTRGSQVHARSDSSHRYVAIAEELKGRIAEGTYGLGEELPTELQLCEEFGASRFTIREALRSLELDLMISRRQGSGSRITSLSPVSIFSMALASEADILRYARDTYIEYTPHDRVPKMDAAMLGLDNPRDWVWLTGIRRSVNDDLKIGITNTYVRREYQQALRDLTTLRSGAVFVRVCDTYELQLSHIDQTVEATTIGSALAYHLSCEVGSPGLRIIRKFFASERPFEVSTTIHPAERFKYSTRLHRGHGHNSLA